MVGGGHDFDAVLKQFLHALLSIFGSGAGKVVDRGHDGVTGGSGYGSKCKKAVGRAAGGQSKEGWRAEAGGAGKSWTAVCIGGGWRDGRDGGLGARF